MNAHDDNRQRAILAIDDEKDILEIIQECLEAEGYKVHTASSAKEGVGLYERLWRQIDLVLLDYLMPEMTGDLVFECLRNVNPDVRVLLLTACDDSVARKMFEMGLRGYLQKPFYLDDFIQRVREEINGD
ncbi:MAG: response regulator [Verrucomicrobiia bacterium]|jgi:DNA-binding response OmpR family regulator